MFYIVFSQDSCEGGPDVEFVAGVFSTKEKAEEGIKTFTELNKEEIPDFKKGQFNVLPCNGPVFVQLCWDFHGEDQNEVSGTFKDETEAAEYIYHMELDRNDLVLLKASYYTKVYIVDKVVDVCK